MTLCFGVYATILKMAAKESVMNRELVSRLVGTIDPENLYGDGGHDDAVSKLMGGTGNFPKSEKSESFGAIRDSSGSTTCVIPQSHLVSPEDLALVFEKDVLCLLMENKKSAAIGALQYAIKSDGTLMANYPVFEEYVGITSAGGEINLPRFLAGVFLYILSVNKNDKESVKEAKAKGFFERFSSYLVTYTNEAVPGYVTAPDDCSSYLKRLNARYENVGTLIYKGAPHPFYELYVPGSLSHDGKKAGLEADLFKEEKGPEGMEGIGIADLLRYGKNIIFSGTGGQGKSMLMRHLLLDAITSYPETHLVPIFVSVKDFDGAIPDILQCAHAFIRGLWPELSMDELQTMCIDGNVLLLFDGLDEIRPDLLASFTNALNNFLDRYLDNMVILSSRPYDNFGSFSRCKVFTLLPFSKEQALALVGKLDYPSGKPQVKREFMDKLSAGLYEKHLGTADNPLLLTIMLMAYDEFREIPSKIHLFYAMAFLVLARLHDEGKGLDRPLATGWSADTFADYFSYFCSITYQKSLTTFTYDSLSKYFGSLKKHYGLTGVDVADFIQDLVKNICLMTNDGRSYDFIHRSFQEYFCARFLYNQEGEKLEKVIPLFDRADQTREDDKTLMMLYDMEPQEVTNHMFIPYLKRLVEKCEAGEGVWTFCQELYGALESADGKMRGREHSSPDSRLYAFINDIYPIRLAPPEPSLLPIINDEVLVSYVEGAGGPKPGRNPQIAIGHIYHFDWNKLKESEEGRKAVEKEDGPFMKEYEAMKNLYKQLADNAVDEDDMFEDMF